MLRQDEPDDYVIASGVAHSVRELVELAFGHVGLDWQEYVHIDESLVRGAAELYDLVGDASKARERLGWAPTLDFDGLVRLLVDADLERLSASRSRSEREAAAEERFWLEPPRAPRTGLSRSRDRALTPGLLRAARGVCHPVSDTGLATRARLFVHRPELLAFGLSPTEPR